MFPLSYVLRPLARILSAGTVSLDTQTPTKQPPLVPNTDKSRVKRLILDGEESQEKQPPQEPLIPKGNELGDSDRTQSTLKKMMKYQPDPKKICGLGP